MSKAIALELAPLGIRINSIDPGAIDTPGASNANMRESKRSDAGSNSYEKTGSSRRNCQRSFVFGIRRIFLYDRLDNGGGWRLGCRIIVKALTYPQAFE